MITQIDFNQSGQKVKAQTEPHTASCIHRHIRLNLWKAQNYSKALTISCDRNLSFTSIITNTQTYKTTTCSSYNNQLTQTHS